jgi:hypothetical protein
MTPSIVTVAPSAEPITVSDVADHLRIDSDTATAQTAWIERSIVAARKFAEDICRRALVTQTRKVALDEFPRPSMNVSSANWYGPQWGTSPGPLSQVRPDGTTGYEIMLPRPPLQSVVSITYYDENNAQQTLDPSQYLVDIYSEPGRITPAPDTTWPATKRRANSVEITFVCGYGDAAEVPEGLVSWMLLRIGAAYANREEVANAALMALPYVDEILNDYRVLVA